MIKAAIVTFLAVTACAEPTPKYSAGTCFQLSPLEVLYIDEVLADEYKGEIRVLFLVQPFQVKADWLHQVVEEKGLVASDYCPALMDKLAD